MKQRIKTLCAGGLLTLTLFGVAAAGPLEDARTADQKGDYATEIRLIRPLAEQGNTIAQHRLGKMYLSGQGVPNDDVQAFVWFRKAAEQGNADAQASLGMMYVDGRGVPQDYAQGLAWFRKAAEQGNASGQGNLGTMYNSGYGVPQDDAQAFAWLRKAAEQGTAWRR